MITTHFDFRAMHDTILKLDILGHADPTVLRMLHEITGIDIQSIPIPDDKVMSLFSGTEALGFPTEKSEAQSATIGLPELGTNFARGMIKEAKPSHFFDLVQLMGLSHGTDVWLGNAQDLIRDGICDIGSVIGCRDSIMTRLIYWGLPNKDSFDIMEKVRKGKGLTPEWEEEMRAHSVPEWYIESCNKIKYMFPKAHAVAYVMLSLRIAWFKVYRPEAYYSARFSMKIDDFDAANMIHGLDKAYIRMTAMGLLGNGAPDTGDETEDEYRIEFESPDSDEEFEASESGNKEKAQAGLYYLLVELYTRGLKFLPIDIYKSDAVYFIPTPEGIRPPIASLQGIGSSAANSIAEEGRRREASGDRYLSVDDFQASTGVNKAVVEVLRDEGCLDGMPESNQISLFDMFG